MSSASTGFFSALGAVLGGAVGAAAGYYAPQLRPRTRYARAPRGSGPEIEDAMVIGGAAGAVVGAFIGGALAGNESPPQLPVAAR
jgi:hypothetical protein